MTREGTRSSVRQKDALPEIRLVSDLQISDGRLKGRYLKASTSKRGKVTVRRLRDGIMRTVARRLKARRFLDLAGGSGIMGLEAISRGAALATMVERSARLRSFIKNNLTACEVSEGHAELSELEPVPFLKQMAKRRRQWDLVFVDAEIEATFREVIKYLSKSKVIADRGALIVQHPESEELPEEIGQLKRWRLYSFEGTSVSYYEKKAA